MEVVLTNAQKVRIRVEPADEYGNPAPVDGVPVWSLSDPSLITLELEPDGMSGYAITVGPVGTCTLTVTADADMGPGVVPISGNLDLIVVQSQATFIGFSTDAPEPK